MGGVEHCLIKEEDCIGVLPRSGATADDIPELRPNGDRILLKVSKYWSYCCLRKIISYHSKQL